MDYIPWQRIMPQFHTFHVFQIVTPYMANKERNTATTAQLPEGFTINVVEWHPRGAEHSYECRVELSNPSNGIPPQRSNGIIIILILRQLQLIVFCLFLVLHAKTALSVEQLNHGRKQYR